MNPQHQNASSERKAALPALAAPQQETKRVVRAPLSPAEEKVVRIQAAMRGALVRQRAARQFQAQTPYASQAMFNVATQNFSPTAQRLPPAQRTMEWNAYRSTANIARTGQPAFLHSFQRPDDLEAEVKARGVREAPLHVTGNIYNPSLTREDLRLGVHAALWALHDAPRADTPDSPRQAHAHAHAQAPAMQQPAQMETKTPAPHPQPRRASGHAHAHHALREQTFPRHDMRSNSAWMLGLAHYGVSAVITTPLDDVTLVRQSKSKLGTDAAFSAFGREVLGMVQHGAFAPIAGPRGLQVLQPTAEAKRATLRSLRTPGGMPRSDIKTRLQAHGIDVKKIT